MSAPLSEEHEQEARVLVPVGNYGKVTVENPFAKGPAKIPRNAQGRPVALGPNGKPLAKGGKRKTLKRKTRKALKRRRYSRRH